MMVVGEDIADSTPESESELTEQSTVMERFFSTADSPSVMADLVVGLVSLTEHEQLSLSVEWAAETALDTGLLRGVSLIASREGREHGAQ